MWQMAERDPHHGGGLRVVHRPGFEVAPRSYPPSSWNLTTMTTGARVYQIWDQQTGALLADGFDSLAEARERLEEMLAETRAMVRATGDSTDGMWLEWVIADPDGQIVAGHSGEPVPWPE